MNQRTKLLVVVFVFLLLFLTVDSFEFRKRSGIFESLFRAPLRRNFEEMDNGAQQQNDDLVKEKYPNSKIINSDKETTLVLEIPGVARDNVRVNLKGNVLTVSGETNFCKNEQEAKQDPALSIDCHLSQLDKKFSQKFTLSHINEEMVKKFWADVQNGVLFVHIPHVDIPEKEIPIVNNNN